MKLFQKHPVLSAMSLAILVVIFLVLLGVDVYGSSFFRDFGSNWLATLLGAIIGVPIVLWVSRYQETETEKERKRKILRNLLTELNENTRILDRWLYPENNGLPTPGDYETSDLSVFLKDESWRAFSDGGELEWIRDPDLLEDLSMAYYRIRAVKMLSERYFTLTINRGVRVPASGVKKLNEELCEGVQIFLDYLDEVKEKIQSQL